MKGLFWNSRGLGDLAKHRYICEVVKEQHLDFVAILETVKKDFSVSSLNHVVDGIFCGIFLRHKVVRGVFF